MNHTSGRVVSTYRYQQTFTTWLTGPQHRYRPTEVKYLKPPIVQIWRSLLDEMWNVCKKDKQVQLPMYTCSTSVDTTKCVFICNSFYSHVRCLKPATTAPTCSSCILNIITAADIILVSSAQSMCSPFHKLFHSLVIQCCVHWLLRDKVSSKPSALKLEGCHFLHKAEHYKYTC